jgi:hypothetical protein
LLLLWLLPLPLFQDHRDSNLEGTGVTMVRGLHQAVPGRLQVVVPVRDIRSKGVEVRGKKSRCGHKVKKKSEAFTPY